MAAMSDHLENRLIDHVFRAIPYTAPTGLFVGLLTANPSDTGGGTEVSGGSYARVNLAPSATNWAATNAVASVVSPSSGTTGTTSNNAAITFAAPTAQWGAITGFGIYDALTGGNLLWWGALTVGKTVNSGDAAPSFQPAALSLQMDN